MDKQKATFGVNSVNFYVILPTIMFMFTAKVSLVFGGEKIRAIREDAKGSAKRRIT